MQMRKHIAFIASSIIFWGAFSVRAEAPPEDSERVINRITWGSVVFKGAAGCDAFTPVLASNGIQYTSFGDCNGLSGNLNRMSMGWGSITGGPSGAQLRDLPTPDLTDTGDGKSGMKPASALIMDGTAYVWIRNYVSNGTQARLKFSTDFTKSASHWTWAPDVLTTLGRPTFVDGTQGSYIYIVAHDSPSAYTVANGFVLIRVAKTDLLNQSKYQYFSGTSAAPAWSFKFSDRRYILTDTGKAYRSGMSFNKARARYYWWRASGSISQNKDFKVSSAPNPWGPWSTIYTTTNWDMNPGESGTFPIKYMGTQPLSQQGTMYLLFSGSDRMNIRKATLSPGY